MKDSRRIFILTVFIIVWISKPIPYEEVVHNRNQFVREEILTLGGGAQDSIDRSSVGKKILLENLFPDWPERIAYQKKQEKFYKSAQAKLRECRRLRRDDKSLVRLLTVQEKDALDYFNGTGFYKEHQNPKTLPNVFDTRQSFLLKMDDRQMRKYFLNSYNNRFKCPS